MAQIAMKKYLYNIHCTYRAKIERIFKTAIYARNRLHEIS